MSAAAKRKLTAAEYLVIERAAAFKSEFYDGTMYAMAGASREHNFIKENLVGELGGQLKGSPFHTLSCDQRVLVEATGLYTYPDVIVLCGPGAYDPADRDTLINPVALIEVLSPSTQRDEWYARRPVFRSYQKIPSLIEFILVAQYEPVCERFVRQADGSWARVSFVGLTDVLQFTSVKASIPLADIYAGVEFPEPELR